MLDETSEVTGLEIYGPDGIFIGRADKLVVDPDLRAVTGIIISDPNPSIVDPGVIVKIPYRWVQAVGDVIILKVFPQHIHADGTIE